MKTNTKDMTTGNTLKIVLIFALPLLIGNIFQQIYNLVDTMIAGQYLGEDAIAAIGATSVLYSLLMNFAWGLNGGYCIVLSRFFGAKSIKRFRQSVSAMVILNVIIGIVLTVIPIISLRPLMRILHTPEEIFESSYTYILIIFIGMIATICYNMCSGFMRAVGNSKTPLYFLIVSSVLNVILDIVLVIVFPFGIAGTAIATVIAQIVSSVLSVWYILKNYSEYLPKTKNDYPDKAIVSEMLGAGLSMAMMNSVFSLGSVIMQRAINQLGTVIITAHTASRRIFEILMIPMATVANANSTFVGQNYGAGRLDRIRKSNKDMIMTECVWSVFSLILCFVFGRAMITWLTGTSDSVIISNAVLNMKVSVILFIPLGILLVLRTSMQAMGHKILPVLSSGIELTVKVISALWIVPVKGYFGVTLTEPSTWVLCAVFLGIFYFTVGKQKKIKLSGALTYETNGII